MKITQKQIDQINQIVPGFFDPEFNPNDEFLNMADAAEPYLFTTASMKNFYNWFNNKDFTQNDKDRMMKTVLGIDSFEEFKKLDPKYILEKYKNIQDDLYEFWDINSVENIKKNLDIDEDIDEDYGKGSYQKIINILEGKSTHDSKKKVKDTILTLDVDYEIKDENKLKESFTQFLNNSKKGDWIEFNDPFGAPFYHYIVNLGNGNFLHWDEDEYVIGTDPKSFFEGKWVDEWMETYDGDDDAPVYKIHPIQEMKEILKDYEEEEESHNVKIEILKYFPMLKSTNDSEKKVKDEDLRLELIKKLNEFANEDYGDDFYPIDKWRPDYPVLAVYENYDPEEGGFTWEEIWEGWIKPEDGPYMSSKELNQRMENLIHKPLKSINDLKKLTPNEVQKILSLVDESVDPDLYYLPNTVEALQKELKFYINK